MLCEATNKDGSKCKAPRMSGRTKFCFFHSPEQAEKRREAHSLGGRYTRKLRPTLPLNYPVPRFKRPKDVTKFLAGIVKCTLTGEVDSKLASVAGYLASVALSAMAAGDESKITRVEFLLSQPQSLNVPDDPHLKEYAEQKKIAEEKQRKANFQLLPPHKKR